MNIIDSLYWRYATKKFDPTKTLPKEKIDIITEAFNLTATSYGLQPIRLVIIQDKEIQKKLTVHSWNQQQVTDASHLLIFCIEKNINTEYINNYFNNVKAIRNTPDAILSPFKNELINSFKNKSPQEITDWASKQAYLAMGNILTVCATEKIDACPMEGFIPEKYNEILDLEKLNIAPVLVMPIGYRAEDDLFSNFKKVRRPIKESVIFYNS